MGQVQMAAQGAKGDSSYLSSTQTPKVVSAAARIRALVASPVRRQQTCALVELQCLSLPSWVRSLLKILGDVAHQLGFVQSSVCQTTTVRAYQHGECAPSTACRR